MSYNNGNFSLFQQTGLNSGSSVFSDQIVPQFSPPSGFSFTNATALNIAPTYQSSGVTAAFAIYGQSLSLSISASSSVIAAARSLDLAAPTISTGTLTNTYALFVSAPTSAGVSQKYAGYLGGRTGIGTQTPRNILDVFGSVAIGTYAGATTTPSNSLVVSGRVGIGTTSPVFGLDIQGAVNAQQAISTGTTFNNQSVQLFEGYSQGGYGGGSVGTQKTMSANTTLVFNTAAVNSKSVGFNGAVFDGKYLYLIPSQGVNTLSGQITRYNTASSFTSSSTFSYAIFDTSVINSNSVGFSSGIFDGRYVYLIPSQSNTFNSFITRYDTTLPFSISTSYSTFNASTFNSNAGGYVGGVFDGRYVYFVPYQGSATLSGQVARLDTFLTVINTLSFTFFNTTTLINSLSQGFNGGTYDGRYVYFAPYQNVNSFSGVVARYDTSLPFSTAGSFSAFDMQANVNSNSVGFSNAVYDGHYVYYIPNRTGATLSGQITRYDTTLPFSTGTSYTVFDTGTLNSASKSFFSGVFDGKYLYLMSYFDGTSCTGQITRYDTTLTFTNSSSYVIFNTASVDPASVGFIGAAFDGRYVYFIPNITSPSTLSGQITRIDAYPGPQANAINASQSQTGLSFGSYAGVVTPPTGGIIMSGLLGIGTTSPSYTVDVQGSVNALPVYSAGTTRNNQLVTLFEGYNQGSLGGGAVGSQKTMSANTTFVFDATTLNSLDSGFQGAVFDGRYVYFVPYRSANSGVVLRYDSLAAFSSSASYSMFDLTSFNALSKGYAGGGAYDGRYIYYVPFFNGSAYTGLITRYDTTLPFAATTSYAAFDLQANINSLSVGFIGSLFDGRYLYFLQNFNSITLAGQIIRYDTASSFSSSASYLLFDTTANINSASCGFKGGAYDGRYLYLAPNGNGAGPQSGQITQYDTSLPFSSTSSYTVFNTTALNSNSAVFNGAVFDGRYIYFVPSSNLSTQTGVVTRFDTTVSFSASTSYSFYDLGANVNSLSNGFNGAIFDGRYVYYVPYLNVVTRSGLVTRFDTTLPFSNTGSYSVFNLASIQSLSVGYLGGVFDGRYVYFSPSFNFSTASGLIARIDAYTGPLPNVINASSSANGIALGTYAGVVSAPTNGLIVSGSVGIGTTTPAYNLDVQGALSAQSAYSAGTTRNNQQAALFEGYNQGGFGGGQVGLQKTMGNNTTAIFSLPSLNSACLGYIGAVFDGRYVYFVPNANLTTRSGMVARYDTFLPFSASSSYATFDMAVNVNTFSVGFNGGVFDGRYVYYIPTLNQSNSQSGTITRYDVTVPFTSSNSYVTYDTKANVNSVSAGFQGALFDGRYLYFCPNRLSNNTFSGVILRYDTTLTFTTAANYSTFDLTANVNTLANGYVGGAFDGRYIYFAPFSNNSTQSGLVTRYDSTLPFATAISYSVFDLAANVNSNACGYVSGTYDGRYVYMLTNSNVNTSTGFLTRYDTTLSFSTAASYSIIDLSTINSLGVGFQGVLFDGRYLYCTPNDTVNTSKSGCIFRYDTTLPFSLTTSYAFYNSGLLFGSNSSGFFGAIFDGRYVYFVPNTNGVTRNGQVTRIDAYPGPQATALSANSMLDGIALGTYAGVIAPPAGGIILSGQLGIGTGTPNYNLDIQGALSVQAADSAGSLSNSQGVQLFQGYTQGGFGGGSVGTNKAMGNNTTAVFNLMTINSLCESFIGSTFDGRYIYFVPNNNFLTRSGFVARYDTTQSFSASASYVAYDLSANINSQSVGFQGAAFDGRFVYYVPNINLTSQTGYITRYDATLPFTSINSYAAFDSKANINSGSVGFTGAVFDGRYLYFVPHTLSSNTASGGTLRYDTSQSFTSNGSYSYFDLSASVNSNANGYNGGTFDGRYVYFVPTTNNSTSSGQFTRYDSTLSFTTATSYSILDLGASVNSNCRGFLGATFDGRYVYMVSNNNGNTATGLLTRYDTTLTFSNSLSYATFDLSTLNSLGVGFQGVVYDGKYVYCVPNDTLNTSKSGCIFRYDTTLSFTSSSSYSFYDSGIVFGSNSSGFFGAIYDGRYVYFVPNTNGVTRNGQITRIDAYSGPQNISFSSIASYTLNGVAVGTYSGVVTPPTGGLILSGSMGVKTQSPAYKLEVQGAISLQDLNSPWTTMDNQLVQLSQGNTQSGYGSSSVGANKMMSDNTTLYFQTKTVNCNSAGFFGGAFDGRYAYFAPYKGSGGQYSGQVTRFDTTASFSSSASYSVFDMSVLSTKSNGFHGAIFDGRYVYFIPTYNGTLNLGVIVRYDTTLSFSLTTSYSIYDTSLINPNSVGFFGGVFDGRYLYLVSFSTFIFTRYDTSLPFGVSQSYALFDLSTVSANSSFFWGGAYDGQYVYLVPYNTGSVYFGQITRYDTTLAFGTSTSYSIFDMAAVNANAVGYNGAVFDGRYIYYVPIANNSTLSGLVARYDTRLPFATGSSYSFFNTATQVSSLSVVFSGGVFDGRYVNFIPGIDLFNTTYYSGVVTRYDVTKSFFDPSSYSIYDTSLQNSFSKGFGGAIFDGKYIYFVPQATSASFSGLVTRIDAYSGAQAIALSAYSAGNGLAIGTYSGAVAPNGSLLVPGSIGIGTTSPAFSVDVFGNVSASQVNASRTTMNQQRAALSQGITQGGYGGGSVGTNKTMSINTTTVFDTGTINQNSFGFTGGIFDGRYVYLIPTGNVLSTRSGQITRYDTASSFSGTSSYSFFDLTTVNSGASAYMGGTFDGRYVYFAPFLQNSSASLITRYDTTLPFSSQGSYSFYNSANSGTLSFGFTGALFDGRYVYFVPWGNFSTFSGTITRYDTTLSFSLTSSFAVFSTLSSLNSLAFGYVGGTFDGRYVYYSPNRGGFSGLGGIGVRYDTTASFTAVASYTTYDFATNVDGNAFGFNGAVFDGRYVYYVPARNFLATIVPFSGLVVRYDTAFAFTSTSAYSTFDTQTFVSTISRGFFGAVFDGRYIYFVPNRIDPGAFTATQSGQITRYDTTQNFSASTSYSILDTTAVSPFSQGFQGGVYDGRYVYLVPYSYTDFTPSGQITRINAYSGPIASGLAVSVANSATFTITGEFGISAQSSATATNGTHALPASPAGFLIVRINGTLQKIPFYNS
ncbi:MAG: hypothetical protein JSS32_06155 [Verrucomicrobia bacterium]|nr:hypothetical protein [Verrucomicrobiota bacterium]